MTIEHCSWNDSKNRCPLLKSWPNKNKILNGVYAIQVCILCLYGKLLRYIRRYFKQCMVMIRFLCFQYFFFCVSSGQPKFKCHLSIYNTDPGLAILFFGPLETEYAIRFIKKHKLPQTTSTLFDCNIGRNLTQSL